MDSTNPAAPVPQLEVHVWSFDPDRPGPQPHNIGLSPKWSRRVALDEPATRRQLIRVKKQLHRMLAALDRDERHGEGGGK